MDPSAVLIAGSDLIKITVVRREVIQCDNVRGGFELAEMGFWFFVLFNAIDDDAGTGIVGLPADDHFIR